MTTRIYLVAACIAGQYQPPRLIEAGTAAAARNHATRDMLTVKPASPKEVAKLVASGVSLEIANEAPPEQQALPGTGTDDGTTGGAGLGSTPELPDPNVVDAEVKAVAEAQAAQAEDPPSGDAWPHTDTGNSSKRRNRSRAAA